MNDRLRSGNALARRLLFAASFAALIATPKDALAEPPAVDLPLFQPSPTGPAGTKTKATTARPRENSSAEGAKEKGKEKEKNSGTEKSGSEKSGSEKAASNRPDSASATSSSSSRAPSDPGRPAAEETKTANNAAVDPSRADGDPADAEHAADEGLLGAAAAAHTAPANPANPANPTATSQPTNPGQSSGDAPVTVTTKISPDPSFVGDRLVLEVIAAYPVGYRVNLPTGVDFAPLHLVEIDEGEPEQSAEGYFRKVFRITLQHFDVGEATVPSFPLTYVGADGEVETVRVAKHAFTVDSLLANEADPERKLEDPPISLEYPNNTAELVIYSAAIAMLVGFLLALFWRRFASRRTVVAGPPPVPAHVLALSALSELENSEFLETGMVQDYYLELTEIAKGYLEGRFGVDALDRTTEEIRRDLIRQRERIQPLEPDAVIRFLEGCDLVKFARFDPQLDEARTALGEVRTMVENTKPITAKPEDETPADTHQSRTADSEIADSAGADSTSAGHPNIDSTGADSAGPDLTTTGNISADSTSADSTNNDSASADSASTERASADSTSADESIVTSDTDTIEDSQARAESETSDPSNTKEQQA